MEHNILNVYLYYCVQPTTKLGFWKTSSILIYQGLVAVSILRVHTPSIPGQ